MEEILAILLQLIGELFLQLFIDGLGEIVWGIAKRLFGRPDPSYRHAVIVLFLLGCLVAALSLLIWPECFFHPGAIPGLSLIASPLLAGLVMRLYGNYRRENNRLATKIATFGGGAALAFGFALVRFIWAR
jgi:hypothetical protein